MTHRSLGWHQANRRNARAYQRAFRRLAELHRDEFARILNEERLKAYAEDSAVASSDLTAASTAPSGVAVGSEHGVVEAASPAAAVSRSTSANATPPSAATEGGSKNSRSLLSDTTA